MRIILFFFDTKCEIQAIKATLVRISFLLLLLFFGISIDGIQKFHMRILYMWTTMMTRSTCQLNGKVKIRVILIKFISSSWERNGVDCVAASILLSWHSPIPKIAFTFHSWNFNHGHSMSIRPFIDLLAFYSSIEWWSVRIWSRPFCFLSKTSRHPLTCQIIGVHWVCCTLSIRWKWLWIYDQFLSFSSLF